VRTLSVILAALLALCVSSCTSRVERERSDLVRAIGDGDYEEFKHLAERGYDIAGPDRSGNRLTPLMWAVHLNQREIADYLLSNGVDVNRQDRYGWTALIYAVLQGDDAFETVRDLVKRGADVNAKDHRGVRPLGYAQAPPGAPRIAQFLRDAGAHE
jgi:ankyrin repeat protein